MTRNESFGLICRFASATASVVDDRRLRANDISPKVVARHVRDGTMVPMTGSTYAVGPLAHVPSMEMWTAASVLDVGPGGFATGETGARRLGLWDRGDESLVHVASPVRGRQPIGPIRFHAYSGSPSTTLVDGTAVLAPIELTRSLARTFTPHQLAAFIREATFRTSMTIDDLEGAVEMWHRCPYLTVVRDALALIRRGSSGTRECSEDVFLAALAALGWSDDVLVNVRGCMGIPGDEPDFAVHHLRKNIEIDGKQHEKEPQRTNDAVRDEIAVRLGWAVLRIRAWRVFYDLVAAMEETATFLFGRRLTRLERARLAPLVRSTRLTRTP